MPSPGTADITLKDDKNELDIREGAYVRCNIDGKNVWAGYAFTIDRGFWFSDDATRNRKWVLHCTDLNILLDKLYIWNHAHPDQFPDAQGRWPNGNVPLGTTDRTALIYGLSDTDINLVTPTINLTARTVETCVIIPPDAKGYFLMPAGTVIRGYIDDIAANSNKAAPGSVVYYIDPDANLFYDMQDTVVADFEVGEGTTGGVETQGLTVTTDISTIKNDVILFNQELDPSPDSTQSKFLYRHNQLTASVNQYGLFQYSEVVSGWSPLGLQVRSKNLLFKEGTPAMRAEFTVFRPGLLPGQIVTVTSATYGFSQPLPIRQVDISFPTPNYAQFTVTCSFDTNDPWGLLLALKRPPSRGFVPPRFETRTLDDTQPPPAVPVFTFIRETPRSLGGGHYQLSYAYIRYGLAVHRGGLRLTSVGHDPGDELGFNETDPDKGQFNLLDKGGAIYAEYHVAHNL